MLASCYCSTSFPDDSLYFCTQIIWLHSLMSLSDILRTLSDLDHEKTQGGGYPTLTSSSSLSSVSWHLMSYIPQRWWIFDSDWSQSVGVIFHSFISDLIWFWDWSKQGQGQGKDKWQFPSSIFQGYFRHTSYIRRRIRLVGGRDIVSSFTCFQISLGCTPQFNPSGQKMGLNG